MKAPLLGVQITKVPLYFSSMATDKVPLYFSSMVTLIRFHCILYPVHTRADPGHA